jgi:hypothetical protein
VRLPLAATSLVVLVIVSGAVACAATGWGAGHLVLVGAVAFVALVSARAPRVALVASVTSLGGIAGIALMAHRRLVTPVLAVRSEALTRMSSFGIGPSTPPELFSTLERGLIVGAALTLGTLGYILASRRTRRVRGASGGSGIIAAAVMTTALLLVVAGAYRNVHRPDIRRYEASLPLVPVSVETSGRKTRVTFEGGRWASYGCSPTLFEDLPPAPMGTVEYFYLSQQQSLEAPPAPLPTPHLRVRHDATCGLWIVECSTSESGPWDVVDHVPNEDYDAERLSPSIAPPRAWVLSGAIGWLLGAAFFVRGVVDRRRARAWTTARAGIHLGDGRVQVEGGESMLVPRAAGLRPGPVVVRTGPDPGARGYRHAPSAPEAPVMEGTREEVLAGMRERAAGWFAVAASLAAAGVVPLAVGAAYGLA